MIDAATLERLAADHPEAFRGGRIDAARWGGVPGETAWRRAEECLAEGRSRRAAYWAGWGLHADSWGGESGI